MLIAFDVNGARRELEADFLARLAPRRIERALGGVELVEQPLVDRRLAAQHAEVVAQPALVLHELGALLLEMGECAALPP